MASERIANVAAVRTLRIAAVALALAAHGAEGQASPRSAPRRAILVSFDGFSEPWMRAYSDSTTAPRLWAMFRDGTCAESVRPAFPSTTPTSHASIWTGAYSNVNGVSASANGVSPWPEHTILETTDGYKASSLRAEPIWITVARQGQSVYSHMGTQSPQPPAYVPLVHDTPALDEERAQAAAAMRRSNIAAVNSYNELVEPGHIAHTPAELAWSFGKSGDSLHARIRDDSTVVVRFNHDARRAVTVRLAPVDTTDPRRRPLARFFSKPLRIDLSNNRRTYVYFRLWELSRDRSKLLLYASEARVVQGNRPDVAAAYDAAVEGVPGNGATRAMEHGELGPRTLVGGDGSAEFRYFETAELVTRQFMRGMEWGWKRYQPRLATDYLPYPDEVLHAFLSFAQSAPGVSPAGRANAARMLRRVYTLVDLRLAQLERLAASTPNTRLFVTGEHGMRPTWLAIKPNVALKNAGLLAVDSAENVDLTRTRALWTFGGWIVVNSTARKGGIVPVDSVQSVLDRAESALRGVRDSAGTAVVTRFFRTGTAEGDSLGLGGAGGGDMYVGLAPGYYWGPSTRGAPIAPMPIPMGEHGFPSTDRDMQPLLCILGDLGVRRIGVVRSIDIAPSVAAWLRVAPPREATGRSLLRP